MCLIFVNISRSRKQTGVKILPSQVNVERWDSNLCWMPCQDRKISLVFLSDPLLSGSQSRGMYPINRMHFLNECSLTNHGPDEIKGKYGGVFPVSRHHFSNCHSFCPQHQFSFGKFRHAHDRRVLNASLNHISNITDRGGSVCLGFGTIKERNFKAVLEETIRK